MINENKKLLAEALLAYVLGGKTLERESQYFRTPSSCSPSQMMIMVCDSELLT